MFIFLSFPFLGVGIGGTSSSAQGLLLDLNSGISPGGSQGTICKFM